MRAAIPEHQRSKVLASLLETEVIKREKTLYECALAVEKHEALKADLPTWDVTP